MVDSDRRPTAQEIEELIDLVRRDPSSPAFIDLAEAYLNLGRPKDAITVCGQGLEVTPDNLEGRVTLARAFAALLTCAVKFTDISPLGPNAAFQQERARPETMRR